jgi:hypothetical protein
MALQEDVNLACILREEYVLLSGGAAFPANRAAEQGSDKGIPLNGQQKSDGKRMKNNTLPRVAESDCTIPSDPKRGQSSDSPEENRQSGRLLASSFSGERVAIEQ